MELNYQQTPDGWQGEGGVDGHHVVVSKKQERQWIEDATSDTGFRLNPDYKEPTPPSEVAPKVTPGTSAPSRYDEAMKTKDSAWETINRVNGGGNATQEGIDVSYNITPVYNTNHNTVYNVSFDDSAIT